MNKKIVALLALALLTQSICGLGLVGIDTTKYVNTGIIGQMSEKMPEFLKANRTIFTDIYNKYQPKAAEIYNYIMAQKEVPNITYISEKIAEIVHRILSNDAANKMLHGIYKIDLAPYAQIIKIAEGPMAMAVIENYARNMGVTPEDARMLKNSIKDFAEWIRELYYTTYKTHIENKLDELFATKDIKEITAKIDRMINDPQTRELVLKGIDKIEANWPYIAKKLNQYGFDTTSFASFKDSLLDTMRNLNDTLNEQQSA